MPAALGWVATRARHAAEGKEFDEPPLSLMQSRQRVGGFATAMHEDLSTAELESLEDDLFRFARIVRLHARTACRPGRSRPGDRGAPGPGHPAARGQGAVRAPSRWSATRWPAAGPATSSAPWTGWSSRPPRPGAGASPGCGRRRPSKRGNGATLSDSLTSLAGAPVELQVVIDEALLSGAVIQIGDLQVDASARGRIDALREHLMPGGWEDSGFHTGAARTSGTTTQTEGAG